MTNSGFEKKLKIAIYNTLNDHRLFNMCQRNKQCLLKLPPLSTDIYCYF